ncbi:hypothetical protein [Bacillus sp. FJAT-29814]|uniref:hypothetical protein n=1 Tax=Bacillus sp. FJAT-29814 TaxID=1729688 RepID=UPI00082F9438|nr:hypothetical protein [Bacillus sp. FJAT-29814]
MNVCELVKKAYELYVAEDKKKETETGKGLREAGNEYIESVERGMEDFIHNRNTSLLSDGKDNYLFSNGKYWAEIGPGKMAKRNFKLFLEDQQTKNIIRTLLKADFTQKQNKDLIREYFEHRDGFQYLQDVYFPRAYTNRLYTILLRDVTTTISNEKVLKEVANTLRIFTSNKSYGELQLDVREVTDKCLIELGLYNDCTTFDKAVVAWYVHELHV